MFLLGASLMAGVAYFLLGKERKKIVLSAMYGGAGIFAKDIVDLRHALTDLRAVQSHVEKQKPQGTRGAERQRYRDALQQWSHERNDWYQHCLGVHSDVAELEALFDACEAKCATVTNAHEFGEWIETVFLPGHRKHTDSLQDHVVQGAQVRLRVVGSRRNLRMQFPVDPEHPERCTLSKQELEHEAQEISEEIAQLQSENTLQEAELSSAQATSIQLANQVQNLSNQLLRVREHLLLELDSASGKVLEAKRNWEMRQGKADEQTRSRYEAAKIRTEQELEKIRAEAHDLQVPKRRSFGHTLAQAYNERHELVSQKVSLHRTILTWGGVAGFEAFSKAFQELHEIIASVPL